MRSCSELRLTIAIAAVGLAAPVNARSLEIAGTAGYLSEWEVKATVAENPAMPSGEMSGAVMWTHTGLCAVEGPVEKTGDLKFRISGWGPFARIDATMSFDQATCSYSGQFADGTKGTMDCSDAKGVPLTLSIK